MKRGILILPLITILISSILYFLPVQTTEVTAVNLIEEPDGYQPDIATGTNLVELTSGYNVTESDSYSYICTASLMTWNVNVSDIIRFTITKVNNSQTWWIADCIWSTMEYYNSYEDTWKDFVTGNPTFDEYLIAGYNSTDFYNGIYGDYYCFIDSIDQDPNHSKGVIPVKIPHNFTAANHSIVNEMVGRMMNEGHINVLFTTPPPGNIAGTWTIWSNDGTDDEKYRMTFNTNGTCTRVVSQMKYKGKWYTAYAVSLQGVEEDGLDPSLLLLAMMGGGGGIGITEILIIAGIIGAIVVIIIIMAIAKSKG